MCERKLISYRFKQWKQWKRLNNKTKNKITRFLKSTLNIYSINFPIVDESSKNFCRFNKNINSACHIFFAKEYYKYYKYITFGFTIYINIKTARFETYPFCSKTDFRWLIVQRWKMVILPRSSVGYLENVERFHLEWRRGCLATWANPFATRRIVKVSNSEDRWMGHGRISAKENAGKTRGKRSWWKGNQIEESSIHIGYAFFIFFHLHFFHAVERDLEFLRKKKKKDTRLDEKKIRRKAQRPRK